MYSTPPPGNEGDLAPEITLFVANSEMHFLQSGPLSQWYQEEQAVH